MSSARPGELAAGLLRGAEPSIWVSGEERPQALAPACLLSQPGLACALFVSGRGAQVNRKGQDALLQSCLVWQRPGQ